MDKNIVIDRILNEINELDYTFIPYDLIADELELDIEYMLFCLKKANELNLTETEDIGCYNRSKLTDFGYNVQSSGGWLKYVYDKNNKQDTIIPKKKAVRISERWYAFILLLITTLFSIIINIDRFKKFIDSLF